MSFGRSFAGFDVWVGNVFEGQERWTRSISTNLLGIG
jgi:hypothetical protein